MVAIELYVTEGVHSIINFVIVTIYMDQITDS